MSGLSNKSQERLLYLISPIGLIVLWQVLLMAGIGDRRFVPAPSDIAWRYWEMVGERRACAATRWSRSTACSWAFSSAAFPASPWVC